MNEAIKKVDDMIGRLVNGIEKRKLSSCVNIVLVSDHGKFVFLSYLQNVITYAPGVIATQIGNSMSNGDKLVIFLIGMASISCSRGIFLDQVMLYLKNLLDTNLIKSVFSSFAPFFDPML